MSRRGRPVRHGSGVLPRRAPLPGTKVPRKALQGSTIDRVFADIGMSPDAARRFIDLEAENIVKFRDEIRATFVALSDDYNDTITEILKVSDENHAVAMRMIYACAAWKLAETLWPTDVMLLGLAMTRAGLPFTASVVPHPDTSDQEPPVRGVVREQDESTGTPSAPPQEGHEAPDKGEDT